MCVRGQDMSMFNRCLPVSLMRLILLAMLIVN